MNLTVRNGAFLYFTPILQFIDILIPVRRLFDNIIFDLKYQAKFI